MPPPFAFLPDHFSRCFLLGFSFRFFASLVDHRPPRPSPTHDGRPHPANPRSDNPFADQTLYAEDTRELPFAVGYDAAGNIQRFDPSTSTIVVVQSAVALTGGIVREGPPVEFNWLFQAWSWHNGLSMHDLRLKLSDLTVKVTVAIRAWQQFQDDAGHCLDILIMLEQFLFWLGQNGASVAWSETYGNLMAELIESVVPEGSSDTCPAALLRRRTSMHHFGFSSARHHPTTTLHGPVMIKIPTNQWVSF
ncbi:hypothetical protein B0H19DRAFT_1072348 [Mycena capillaripes]|nr:hypothetical protein B0H19DRAFT_1072348 [Mycena capillaripes]